jgi:hypothetical protein
MQAREHVIIPALVKEKNPEKTGIISNVLATRPNLKREKEKIRLYQIAASLKVMQRNREMRQLKETLYIATLIQCRSVQEATQ